MAEKTAQLAESTRDMATKTAQLVEGTTEANLQADRHHQEGLLPIVTLNANLLREFGEQDPATGKPAWKFALDGACVNAGQGPALNVSLVIHASGYAERTLDLGTMSAGGAVTLGNALNMGMPGWDSRVPAQWHVVPTNEYEDRTGGPLAYDAGIQFDSLFTIGAPAMRGLTVQHTHSGLARDLRVLERQLPAARPRSMQPL